MKTEHIGEHCGTHKCPRCAAVYEMLRRFQFRLIPDRGSKLFQLAEHAVESEEESAEYSLQNPPTVLVNANGDVFPAGIQIPPGTEVRHGDKVVARVVRGGENHPVVKLVCSDEDKYFQGRILKSPAVESISLSNPPDIKLTPSKATGQLTVKKVDLNVDNLNKCVQAKYRAYLFDDALLEEALETGTYNGENVIQVYLDDFVCEKKEKNVVVKSGGLFGDHIVRGKSDFPARAARFGFRCPDKLEEGWAETFLNGNLHLVWFINDQLKSVVKNLALYEYKEFRTRNMFYLENPRFVASDIIDRRETCLEGEQGKRVSGWAKPALLAGEKVDD